MTVTCRVCFRKCRLREGETGICGVRRCADGVVVPINYGVATALALDPIEKKPLYRFMPGSMILSMGSYGCNLHCPFCQNSDISWSEDAFLHAGEYRRISPRELADLAVSLKCRGNIGVAFTYNEPLVSYEFVAETSKLLHERNMKSVMVTNGTADLSVLAELRDLVDAMNIDLKGFSSRFYKSVLKGDLDMVKTFIVQAVRQCHVELTTLIVPHENDSDEEIISMAKWISGLTDEDGRNIGKSIPWHLSRFFPRFRMTDRPATDVKRIYHLVALAQQELDYVYPGNCQVF